MQCSRVDLPEPEAPMMAVYSPAANSTDTPRSASTAANPSPKTFRRSTARAAAVRVSVSMTIPLESSSRGAYGTHVNEL